jgi:glycosyltransferase involved in cell wall biosynthesis
MPALSVVIPAYNEAENIVGALQDVLTDVASVVADLEIIVVDDGSRDKTAVLAMEIAANEPRISVVRQANQGHGPAILNGLAAAKGDWLLLLDSDRQILLGGFAEHWALTATHDAVLGLRRPRHDPPHRLLVSAGMRLLLKLQLGVWVGDAGTPYKLVRAAVWREERRSMRDGCWIPSALLAAGALRRRDLTVAEVPVIHQPRRHGPTTLNLRRLARFCTQGVAEILHYRRQLMRRPGRPGQQ